MSYTLNLMVKWIFLEEAMKIHDFVQICQYFFFLENNLVFSSRCFILFFFSLISCDMRSSCFFQSMSSFDGSPSFFPGNTYLLFNFAGINLSNPLISYPSWLLLKSGFLERLVELLVSDSDPPVYCFFRIARAFRYCGLFTLSHLCSPFWLCS
jgi:hypothetical protein